MRSHKLRPGSMSIESAEQLSQLLLGFRVITASPECVKLERIVDWRVLKATAAIAAALFLLAIVASGAAIYLGFLPGEIHESPAGIGPYLLTLVCTMIGWLICHGIRLGWEREYWRIDEYTLNVTKTLFRSEKFSKYGREHLYYCVSSIPQVWSIHAMPTSVLYSGTDADLFCESFGIRFTEDRSVRSRNDGRIM